MIINASGIVMIVELIVNLINFVPVEGRVVADKNKGIWAISELAHMGMPI